LRPPYGFRFQEDALGVAINANQKKDCDLFAVIAEEHSETAFLCPIPTNSDVLSLDIESLQIAEKDIRI
jgi:hypothetical protein